MTAWRLGEGGVDSLGNGDGNGEGNGEDEGEGEGEGEGAFTFCLAL